jgi:predicted lipoprotein with Yx(FWY)xxD motif
MTRAPRAAALLGALTLILSACGAYGGASIAPSAEPSAAPSTEPDGATLTVNAVADTTLAAYLTGDDGRTLYINTNDNAGTSTCTGDCAASWPPFTLGAGETVAGGAGVTGTFGTSTRDDGSTQVTYNGAPLYYFVADTAAGTTNGQGVGGVWFVAPAGASASATPTPGQTRLDY